MAIFRKVFRFLIKKNFFKNVLLYSLKELAKMTENNLDDQFVKVIEARLYPKGK